MKSIIRFSMKNTVAIFIIILLLIGGGLYSLSQMHKGKYPKVDIPYLHVIVPYPGASPSQVIQDIQKPVEQQIKAIDGVENIYAIGQQDEFYMTVQFSMSKDFDQGMKEVLDALAKVKMPELAKAPVYQKEYVDSGPFLYA
jgi:multidrug efflux pump subunit AcrB